MRKTKARQAFFAASQQVTTKQGQLKCDNTGINTMAGVGQPTVEEKDDRPARDTESLDMTDMVELVRSVNRDPQEEEEADGDG